MRFATARGGPRYCPEAKVVFAAMTLRPDYQRKKAINALIVALKQVGVWEKLDHLFVLAAADARAASIDWITATALATAVNSPTFTADRGYAGNGTSSYVNLGVALTSGPLFAQDAATQLAYCRTNSGATASPIVGTLSAAASTIYPRSTSDSWASRTNKTGSDATANTDSRGLFAWTRTSSSAVAVYRNGDLAAAFGASASTGVGAGNATIGRTSGDFGARQVSLGAWGGVFTAQNHADCYAAFQAYMTTLQGQV